MPSAPFAVSSQSRKKLKTFAFDEKLIVGQEEKENQSGDGEEQVSDNEHNENARDGSFHHVPHTPAVRIPFEDLIANTEDAFNCAPPLATPKDHVLWDPESSAGSKGAAGTQRSRKRALSSSPASSQQLSAQKDAMNLDALNRSLRTPHNDPTQDLWNRYTTANALKHNRGEPILPAYAHLLPSSPQTPNGTNKDSGLRRTHSCGVEWPTSKAKRRKTENRESLGRTKDLFAASRKDILRRDLSNNTRVGLLLEKIQESLAKKAASDESPSSSSPLPDRRSQVLVSPTRPQNKEQSEPSADTTTDDVGNEQDATPNNKSRPGDSFSSEFDDDGLDLEAFESIEHAMAQGLVQDETAESQSQDMSTRGAAGQARSRTISPQPTAQCGVQRNTHDTEDLETVQHQAPVVSADVDNEFDDDDDDEELMNEMLDLAARYDSQPKSSSKKVSFAAQSIPPSEAQPKRLETLDEFEDAFDDDDDLWEGIANATSLEAAVTRSTDLVRSR